MTPALIFSCIAIYFFILLLIAWVTTRKVNNESYFLGNKASPWYVVAFGMLGDSLSGVTFISVPGAIGGAHFSYLQLVLGYIFGYFVISEVLLPLYYRNNLTSIYTYLKGRFGERSQKTGAGFFLLSRLLGAAARLYLAATVIQLFIFGQWGIPFWVTVTVIIVLILIYTQRGGIKTLVWTDTFQSTLLLAAVLFSIYSISSDLGLSFSGMVRTVRESPLSEVFFWDWQAKSFFPKQFFGGLFIAVCMTGLDQNLMQKNLSCRSLPEAQTNIRWFSIVMAMVNVFFLCLGVLLYTYLDAKGLQLPLNDAGKPITDRLFPMLALEHLGLLAGMAFIIGLTAATFSSADSVLTTLTTSFYIDFLKGDERKDWDEQMKRRRITIIHRAFAVLLLLVILIFKALNNSAIIDTVLMLAGYTYGPLLGLFSFGILTGRKIRDRYAPLVCIAAPLIIYILDKNDEKWLGGYQFGNELLLVNGLLTFAGLWLISRKK